MVRSVQPSGGGVSRPRDRCQPGCVWVTMLAASLLVAGCARYPANQPIAKTDRGSGYREGCTGMPGNSEHLVLYLTFSGGGTRAAAFSYGVLEELGNTVVAFDGKSRRPLDEVDEISAVSGGSFTAGYYGLFGEQIFEDFETRFVKKNIQGALATRVFLKCGREEVHPSGRRRGSGQPGAEDST